MKSVHIIATALIAFGSVSGCSGGPARYFPNPMNEQVSVSGYGEQATVNSSQKTNLSISGSNNTVDVYSDLSRFSISGSNNRIRFAAGLTVDTCSVSGMNNTVTREGNLVMSCNVSGQGNRGF